MLVTWYSYQLCRRLWYQLQGTIKHLGACSPTWNVGSTSVVTIDILLSAMDISYMYQITII
jgi:hypothetical protein